MKMKKEELKEINDLLEEAGIRPRWCDTAVPLSGSTVRCGCPTEPGDMDYSEYILLPKSLVGQHPEMFIPAVGDSMRDAGFETDDMLRVRFNVTAHDGDNVLAWIDGQCTVKVLFTDDDGKKWLVPRVHSGTDPTVHILYTKGTVPSCTLFTPKVKTAPSVKIVRKIESRKFGAVR